MQYEIKDFEEKWSKNEKTGQFERTFESNQSPKVKLEQLVEFFEILHSVIAFDYNKIK